MQFTFESNYLPVLNILGQSVEVNLVFRVRDREGTTSVIFRNTTNSLMLSKIPMPS